jgi:hypothetical protein
MHGEITIKIKVIESVMSNVSYEPGVLSGTQFSYELINL